MCGWLSVWQRDRYFTARPSRLGLAVKYRSLCQKWYCLGSRQGVTRSLVASHTPGAPAPPWVRYVTSGGKRQVRRWAAAAESGGTDVRNRRVADLGKSGNPGLCVWGESNPYHLWQRGRYFTARPSRLGLAVKYRYHFWQRGRYFTARPSRLGLAAKYRPLCQK